MATLISSQNIQLFNTQLISSIEGLKKHRETLFQNIKVEEEKKSQIDEEIKILSEQSKVLNQNISEKQQKLSQYDSIISQSDTAFYQILSNSETLLHLIQKETKKLNIDQSQPPNENKTVIF